MVSRSFESKTLSIGIPLKANIDLDALNYIASGENEMLCRVAYSADSSRHNFEYIVDDSLPVSRCSNDFKRDNIINLIKSLVCLINTSQINNLNLCNFSFVQEHVFFRNGGYRYIYIPEDDGKNSNVKNDLVKFFSSFHIKDQNIHNLIKNIKKAKTDGDVVRGIKQFVSEPSVINSDFSYGVCSNDNCLSDFEDTDEGETTMLSFDEDSKRSNTVRITELYHNEFSECETTPFFTGNVNPVDNRRVTGQQGLSRTLYLIRNATGEKIAVNGSFFLIGKDPEQMDYVLDNGVISRHHATITLENDVYYIMDNKSTNGTSIEGVFLQPYEKAELGDGAIVSLGNENFQIRIEGE